MNVRSRRSGEAKCVKLARDVPWGPSIGLSGLFSGDVGRPTRKPPKGDNVGPIHDPIVGILVGDEIKIGLCGIFEAWKACEACRTSFSRKS